MLSGTVATMEVELALLLIASGIPPSFTKGTDAVPKLVPEIKRVLPFASAL